MTETELIEFLKKYPDTVCLYVKDYYDNNICLVNRNNDIKELEGNLHLSMAIDSVLYMDYDEDEIIDFRYCLYDGGYRLESYSLDGIKKLIIINEQDCNMFFDDIAIQKDEIIMIDFVINKVVSKITREVD